MAPLLFSHFRARHRSVLTGLFGATFLAAVAVVAMPCPAREKRTLLDEPTPVPASNKEVIVMMNQRGRRRFMEE
jgi:hypothetical protein